MEGCKPRLGREFVGALFSEIKPSKQGGICGVFADIGWVFVVLKWALVGFGLEC